MHLGFWGISSKGCTLILMGGWLSILAMHPTYMRHGRDCNLWNRLSSITWTTLTSWSIEPCQHACQKASLCTSVWAAILQELYTLRSHAAPSPTQSKKRIPLYHSCNIQEFTGRKSKVNVGGISSEDIRTWTYWDKDVCGHAYLNVSMLECKSVLNAKM